MMYAKKIKMKASQEVQNPSLEDIDEIFIEGANNPGFFKTGLLHDLVTEYPQSVRVNDDHGPFLEPVNAPDGWKYVKSATGADGRDALFTLPKE